MNQNWFPFLPLFPMLAVAAGFDIATRRIPNAVVGAGAMLGLVFGIMAEFLPNFGGIGFSTALAGIAVGMACLLPLYALGAMGAGDVKLMAAVGAFLGPWQTLGAVLLALAAGGLLSLAAAVSARSLGQVLGNLRLMLLLAMSPKGSGLALSDVQTTGRLPYALAIAAGTGLQLWLAARGGWLFA